jgi:hypothetical protein
MNDNPLKIPKTPLRADIDEAAAIKRAMLQQLQELEERATGHSITKPGAWRHDPTGWADRNLPPT